MSLRYLWIMVLLLGSIVAPSIQAQNSLPTTGTQFTFAIPEGADNLIDPSSGKNDSSKIFLYLISSTEGTGTLWSPSGVSLSFAFCRDTVATIVIPYELMHLHDVGKTQKGIIVQTTEPVQLILHDYFPSGGEITQLYPDEALDTAYRIATWGLYNDLFFNQVTNTIQSENNKTEFVITAPYDSTIVTVTSKVQPIGIPGSFPIMTTRLDRGECLMIKADSTSLPVATSLSGSRVSSTKPVSVISASTCAYVPALPFEACNELLNMESSKNFTDTIFYTAGFGRVTSYALLFISETPSFFVIASDGSSYQSNNGTLLISSVSQPLQCYVTAPAKCYELSVGFDASGSGLSDPSIINVLPRSLYSDSLLWYSPEHLGFGQYAAQFVTVIYPQTAESQILLDGVPLIDSATPKPVLGTSYSSMIAEVQPGLHRLTSPDPVYAHASGFSLADAYSYNIGAFLPPAKTITIASSIDFDSTAAQTCRDFDIVVLLKPDPADNLTDVSGTVTFDPTLSSLLTVEKGPVGKANFLTTNTTTSGKLSFDLSGYPIKTTGDTIMILHFHAGSKTGVTPFTLKVFLSVGECNTTQTAHVTKTVTKPITITEVRDTSYVAFHLSIDNAKASEKTIARVSLTKPLPDSITSLTLHLTYDHDLLELLHPADPITAGSVLTSTISLLPITHPDPNTDDIHVTFTPAADASIVGEFLRIPFLVYVAKTNSTTITSSFDLANQRECPLDILAPIDSTTFRMLDTCSTPILRQALNGKIVSISRIVPNPVTESMTIVFDRTLPVSIAAISLSNVIGQPVRQWTEQILFGQSELHSPKLGDLPSGVYYYDITVSGMKYSGSIVIRN